MFGMLRHRQGIVTMKKFLLACATVGLAFVAVYYVYQTWKRCYGDDNGDDDSNDVAVSYFLQSFSQYSLIRK